jgi:transcriptional regulator with XRE-family HTH domain
MPSSLHNVGYQIFRQLLLDARLASALTQVEVAQKLNKPQSYVSKYERGERRLDFSEFLELADVLGIDVVSFIEIYRSQLPDTKRKSRR